MSSIPPGPTRAELAQEVLLRRMRQYSEDFHCADWLSGLEYVLWDVPDDDNSPSGQVRREISQDLRILAEIAGDWWAWDPEIAGDENPVFIPMERWKQIVSDQASD